MSWNRSSPTCLVLGLLIGWCLIATLHAQNTADPCFHGGNYNISFPEENTSTMQKVSDTDQRYVIEVRSDISSQSYTYQFNDYFVVEYNTVQRFKYIRMIKPIDRDGLTSGLDDDVNILQYQLLCTHPSGSIIYSILRVQITDINDNSPVFVRPPYTTSISELTPVGQIFYRDIMAEDKDEGANRQLVYRLSDIPGAKFPGVNNFTIAIVGEGFVAVSRVLDFERMYRATGNRADLCYYNLTVIATDQGTIPRSSTTSLLINIEDDDDQGPEFVYPTCVKSTDTYGQNCIRARFLSNLRPTRSQTLVFTPYPADTNNPSGTVNIIAQDRDTLNSPIFFRIARTLPAGFEQYFSVSAVRIGHTKQYRCVVTYSPVNNTRLSRKSVPSLDIIIQATENTFNRRQETATISVNLIQTNTGPPVISPSSATGYIYENSPTGTLVSKKRSTTTALRLTFSDRDLSPSDPVPQYNIRVSGGPFTVTPAGYVQLQMSVLDYEQTRQYTLTVTITDPATPTDKARGTYTVNVLDVNDLYPIFTANYDVTIQEGDYTQSPQVLVTDVNEFSPTLGAYYSTVTVLETATLGSPLVTIPASDADVSLRIVATDLGGKSAVMFIMVTINHNLQAPVINPTSYTQTIPENTALGTGVVQITASDRDINSPWKDLSYQIVSDPSSQQYFGINHSGSIILKQPLVQTNQSEFNMKVQVSDKGSPPNMAITLANVRIIVTKNKYNPMFFNDTYSLVIPESQPIGSVLVTVTARDNDTEFNQLTYFVEGDQTAQHYFGVDPNTGAVTVKSSLIHAGTDYFTLRIVATYLGGKSAVIFIMVTINHNLQAPVINPTSYTQTIPENTALGTGVVQITASDRDINSPWKDLSYQIVSDPSSQQYFGINHSGSIILKQPLVQTNQSEFNMKVQVSDKGSPPNMAITLADVRIIVTKNKYNPMFFNDTYSLVIPESQPIGSVLVTVTARDNDTEFNLLTYFVEGDQTAQHYFGVDPNTGAVTVKSSLIQTGTDYFTLRVGAFDNGVIPRRAYTLVFIRVTRNQ